MMAEIDKQALKKIVNEIADSPLAEVLAIASAFVHVTENLMDRTPDPTDLSEDFRAYLVEVTETSEYLLSALSHA